jgi:hypothetical protein
VSDGAVDVLWVVLRLVFGLGLVVALVLGAVRWNRRQQEVEAAREQERKDTLRDAVARGVLHPDGSPVCLGCGGVATLPPLRTGRPWFDQLPGFRVLNSLWVVSPRLIVVEAPELGPCFCATCQPIARDWLEHGHTKLRATRSTFNSREQAAIAELDAGVATCVNKRVEQTRSAVDRMQRYELPPESDTHQLPLLTSGGSRIEDERPN